tara:strand:+ start:550 stop:852 length:303 start_codon:yes stop_codon:yes gene_type:complete
MMSNTVDLNQHSRLDINQAGNQMTVWMLVLEIIKYTTNVSSLISLIVTLALGAHYKPSIMKGDELPTRIDIYREVPRHKVKAPNCARLSLFLNLIWIPHP